MGNRISILIAVVLLLALVPGCVDLGDDDDDIPSSSLKKPEWYRGMHWTYVFTSPDLTTAAASKLIVADVDDENYRIGVDTIMDARRHAVLNFNPILGRVDQETMGIYEKGVPQVLVQFPIDEDDEWSFSMFDVDNFDAFVRDIRREKGDNGTTTLVDIEAAGEGGELLMYTYDSKAGWLSSLLYKDDNGGTQLEMTLVEYGDGYTGEAYFVRGTDLFENSYSGAVASVENTFFETGHAKDGRFDDLIFHINVEIDSDGGEGTLTLKDEFSDDEAVLNYYGSGHTEQSTGRTDSVQGNWTLTVTLSGDSYLDIRIAGGNVYSWNV